MTGCPDEDARLSELALAAGRGDRPALDEFVRGTQRDVWRFLAHLAGSRQADDLAQETYLRALRSLPGFAGRSSARTWLLSIARRVVADHARSAPGAAPGLVDPPGEGPGFEEVVELRISLAALDRRRREALLLTQVLGLSYREVAEVCGCPVGTVRSRVARAREDLFAQCDRLERGAG